jgi:ubiquinone/menaquinone biosynthesis C-methylase UbiE
MEVGHSIIRDEITKKNLSDGNEIMEDQEKKYETAWRIGAEHNSRTALPFANHIASILPKDSSMLDLGCGDGMVISILNAKGFNAWGVDITLAGLGMKRKQYNESDHIPSFTIDPSRYTKAPLWDMPFVDRRFDYTFSCDVLEHIPENKLEKTIKEILRITRYKTLHVIATFADRDFHPTVKPIDWWQYLFAKYENESSCKIVLCSRKVFLYASTGYVERIGF